MAPSTEPVSTLAEGMLPADHAASMASVDGAYWWHAERARLVARALQRHGATPGMDLVDVGTGTGGTVLQMAERLAAARVLGVDHDERLLDAARARGLPVLCAGLDDSLRLPWAPQLLTALDVLEHIPDPVPALRAMARVAAPSALLAVTVPAVQGLFSGWDTALGHFRRYDSASLAGHLSAGGWEVLQVRYVFGWTVLPALYRRARHPPGRPMDTAADFPGLPAVLNRALGLVCRLEARLADDGRRLPVGTSLLGVARRSAT